MEQRIYHGNIDPNALADYLVQTFNQNFNEMNADLYNRYTTRAQKVGQGDHILVQITRARQWSGRIRGALGVSISKVADGISVSTGQSNWLNLDDPSIAGMLIGALFFPPLLIFPVIRGISSYTFYQDIWNAIDTYSSRVGAQQGATTTAHGIYCPYCGAVNDEGVTNCHACGSALNVPASDTPAQTAPEAASPKFDTVICPQCSTRVPAAKFCGNCAALLPEISA